ncbi:hypothetical protein D6853_06040 [Butyrivibrio sp. X503]|uniref:hypothetical protein n=1 Tax=Butyrivibrio sp. X503 TaxID=2364878 RepID=UPI000EA9D10B|nr:hypothetical protein [Butyrivibrio sp. X503]RKM56350.1 hypothetical protein D6853_06040 [Butyrivibrio sp. X503]
MQKNDEYIYVVLVRALTGLGQFARKLSGYEYTHIAVCFDEKLDDFITFSRKRHFAPFDSGFMHETLDCYAFGKNEKVKLKVFKIPVNAENMQRIRLFVDEIAGDKDYLFNLLSMATMGLFHGFRIYKAHNCMSFVGKIISLSGAVPMDKKYYKYDIRSMDELLSYFIYKEDFFYKTDIKRPDYMDRCSVFKNAGMFLALLVRLVYRMIFKSIEE